jgi:hypothetical protein
MQKCIDLAASATPKNAHEIRVKFDIYKFFGSKLLPALYGDKPAQATANVSVAVVISPERLNAIRGKLEASRTALAKVISGREKKAKLPQSLLDFDRAKHSNTNGEEHPTNDEHPCSDKPLAASQTPA